jgi:hypothetical protein
MQHVADNLARHGFFGLTASRVQLPGRLQSGSALSTNLITISMFLMLWSVALSSCSEGAPPKSMYIVCLGKPSEVSAIRAYILNESKKRGLTFTDGSFEATHGLSSPPENIPGGVKLFSARDDKTRGFSVTNLGLPANQVILSFTEGTPDALILEVAADVSRRWRTDVVPYGQGAQAMSDC